MVKAPTRAFSLLKALTTAFTLKTLLGPQAFFAEESINSFGFLQSAESPHHISLFENDDESHTKVWKYPSFS